MPDDGVLDQPEWEAFERGAPPPPDGGSWLWGVPQRVRIEVVQDDPHGHYTRVPRVYRQTSKGNWYRFARVEEVVQAAYRGEDVGEAARMLMASQVSAAQNP